MLKKILEDFEKKIMGGSISIPLTINIEMGGEEIAPAQSVEVIDVVGSQPDMDCIDAPVVPDSQESIDDAKFLAAIDDYFKTLNDGQYSPLSGENNNASNSTEVYQIAKKHNVDPSKLMTYLGDTAIFDKFQELSIPESAQIDEYKHRTSRVGRAKDMARKVVYGSRFDEHIASAVIAVMGGSTIPTVAGIYGIDVETLRGALDTYGGKLREGGKGSAKKSIKKGKEKALVDKTKGNPVAKNVSKKGGRMKSEVDYDRKKGKNIDLDETLKNDKLGEKPDYYTELEKMEEAMDQTKPNVARMDGPYRDKHGRKFYFDLRKGAYYLPHYREYVDVRSEDGRELAKMTLPGIDTARYGNREYEGLEGPYTNKHGKVFYYDRSEGRYYDPDSDFYMGLEFSLTESKPSVMNQAINMLMEGKEMSTYEYQLMALLDKLNIDYLFGKDGVVVDEPWNSQIKKVYPQFAGILQRSPVDMVSESATGGATCSGAIASSPAPMGNVIKRKTNETEACDICKKDPCKCD